jgi:hypothetical protein
MHNAGNVEHLLFGGNRAVKEEGITVLPHPVLAVKVCDALENGGEQQLGGDEHVDVVDMSAVVATESGGAGNTDENGSGGEFEFDQDAGGSNNGNVIDEDGLVINRLVIGADHLPPPMGTSQLSVRSSELVGDQASWQLLLFH